MIPATAPEPTPSDSDRALFLSWVVFPVTTGIYEHRPQVLSVSHNFTLGLQCLLPHTMQIHIKTETTPGMRFENRKGKQRKPVCKCEKVLL